MAEKKRQRKADIYAEYRQVLGKPKLRKQDIDKMREHLILLAQTICEHVWGKKFY